MKGQPERETSPTEKDENEENDMAEEGEEGTENERKVNQCLIDDVVKELVKMELSQREKEGEEKGFEAGSNHSLN